MIVKRSLVSSIALSLSLFFGASATVLAKETFKGGVAKSNYGKEASTHTFKDGKFVWQTKDKVLVEGTYEVHGKYLIVTDTAGPRACLDTETDPGISVGIYTWETWEDKQYLVVNDDDCSGRQRGFLSLGIDTSK
jgi:hypothetical protein